MRPLAAVGAIACAIALGSLIVGRSVLMPELSAQSGLIDANLAAALRAPVHLRLAEVVLAAHLVVAASAGRWLQARWSTSVGLVLVGLSGVQRFVLLPALYGAWAKADLVASRPIEFVLTGSRLQWQEMVLVGVMAVLQLTLLLSATRRMHIRDHKDRHPSKDAERSPQAAPAAA